MLYLHNILYIIFPSVNNAYISFMHVYIVLNTKIQCVGCLILPER